MEDDGRQREEIAHSGDLAAWLKTTAAEWQSEGNQLAHTTAAEHTATMEVWGGGEKRKIIKERSDSEMIDKDAAFS